MIATIKKGIFEIDDKIATQNLVKSQKVYGERLVKKSGIEYRIWNPYRSKLAAAVHNGLKSVPFSEGSKVLYLGASTGTTASHISDIVDLSGVIYCVEFAPRVFSSLAKLCETRRNMIPILADAKRPEEYIWQVEEVDVIYQDLAQIDQSKIFIKNVDIFLKSDGIGILAIKSRSIDVTKEPNEIFKNEKKILSQHNLKIIEDIKLTPYEKDHAFFIIKK